jgi:PhzF family phenazine biosynthesis protein
MHLNCYHIDAFAKSIFTGNPAAVVPLDTWLDDSLMQSIAAENNLSETVFFVKEDDFYKIRWFSPTVEIPLCGHATLAAAYVLYNYLDYRSDTIIFQSLSGQLIVKRVDDKIQLNFPAIQNTKVVNFDLFQNIIPYKILNVASAKDKYLVHIENEEDVYSIDAQIFNIFNTDKNIIITAKSKSYDFVSRFFAPHVGIAEDPVTGSAHCLLVPYWANLLHKNSFHAYQASSRGGELWCNLDEDRVFMSGYAIVFKISKLYL